MGLFHRRKQRPEAETFDLATRQPAVRKSICTGEITVGYIDRATGKFHELMLAPDQHAAEAFFQSCGAGGAEIKVLY